MGKRTRREARISYVAAAAGLLIKFMHPECPTEAATQGVSVCVCVCLSVCVCVINAQLLKLLMKNDF